MKHLIVSLLFVTFCTGVTVVPNACESIQCVPNSKCEVIGGVANCTCLENYIGSPPQCQQKCLKSSECISQLACIRSFCSDPCPGLCGLNTKCSVVDHQPKCTCLENYFGDPYLGCRPECVENSDCSSTRVCIRNKCEDSMCAGVTCDEHSGCVEADGKTSCVMFRDPVIVNPCKVDPRICQ